LGLFLSSLFCIVDESCLWAFSNGMLIVRTCSLAEIVRLAWFLV
jgi:hypothetical protein